MFKFLKKDRINKADDKIPPNKHTSKHVTGIQREIEEYEEVLANYGINFVKLAKLSPSSMDTRSMLIDISKRIAKEETLMKTLHNEKRLPITDIVETFKVDKKVIKKNAQYLIAITMLEGEKYSGIREVMRV